MHSLPALPFLSRFHRPASLLPTGIWSGCCGQLSGGRGYLSSEFSSGCQTPESALIMWGHILEIVENHWFRRTRPRRVSVLLMQYRASQGMVQKNSNAGGTVKGIVPFKILFFIISSVRARYYFVLISWDIFSIPLGKFPPPLFQAADPI